MLFVFYARVRSNLFPGNEKSQDPTSAADSKDEPIHTPPYMHMYGIPMPDLEYIIELKVNQILDDRERFWLRNRNMKRKMSL